MARHIDHIVIAVRDLKQASADYERAGFTVTPGGEHASGGTYNALVCFADGTYFELIAFRDVDEAREHRWWPELARGEGYVDFALGSDALAVKVDEVRAAGLEVEGPRDGGRQRPDGEELRWRTLWLRDEAGTPLPFVIEDVTPRELRVPGGAAADHALGVTRVEGVRVVVADLARGVESFRALLGSPGVPIVPVIAGVGSAHRFFLGEQWIVLSQPDDSPSEIRQYLQQHGPGAYEVTLGGPAAAESAGRRIPVITAHGARIRVPVPL
jgi:hypothetical protein